jgi:hypothetical protein
MVGKRLVVICAFILSLLVVAGAGAQAPSIPPDIKAIFDKAKSGQALTSAETKRLTDWGKSMSAAASGGAGNASAASASADPAMGVQGQKPPCPRIIKGRPIPVSCGCCAEQTTKANREEHPDE